MTETRDSQPSLSEDGNFDPGRFQAVAVPPQLREQLAHTKLPRLEARYFEDTDPANVEQSPSPAETGRRSSLRSWVGLSVLVAAAGVALLLVRWLGF